MYGLAFKHAHVVKIPEEYHFVYNKYLRLVNTPKYSKMKNKMRAIAEKLGVTESRLHRIVNVMAGLKQSCQIESLETTSDNSIPDLSESCTDTSNQNLDLLRKSVTPEEFFVLDHILGLLVPAPKTLNWIGNILGVTKERVRQIKNSGLAKFKEAYLDEYGGEPGEEYVDD
jgi:DNA-directed RNA polymerase sigma subunit (sigma70/sigma32)